MTSRLLAINDWLRRAHEAHYDCNRLAALCQISTSQLRRFFLAYFYRPPQDWLDELRLWDAMEILAQGEPVKQVAFAVHFGSVAHFCHRFKEYHGCRPSEFRRIHASTTVNLLKRPWI